MHVITYRNDETIYNVCCGGPEDLLRLLIIFEASDEVKQYKVFSSSVGFVEDFYIQFGWGNAYFIKNSPNGFVWNK